MASSTNLATFSLGSADLEYGVSHREFWREERGRRLVAVILLVAAWAVASTLLSAHGVSDKDARYLLSLN